MSQKPLSHAQLDQIISQQTPSVVLETAVRDQENRHSFLFTDFHKVITFGPGDDVQRFFSQVQRYHKQGFWLAGYFAYEFGYWLEPALSRLQSKYQQPLVWIGISKEPQVFFHQTKKKVAQHPDKCLSAIKPNLTQRTYQQKIATIKKYLAQGQTYQVNFTFKQKFSYHTQPWHIYQNVRAAQPTAYTAYINTDSQTIISVSPELFFRINKNMIYSRPMKGTISRGRTLLSDKKKQQWLAQSKKIRAENVMIVDLLRNDLSRIATQVRAPKLFTIEKHPTLHQMTSTIAGKLKTNVTLQDIFRGLFPCGSVTGAPKIKTMEIIHELEKEPRGVYTGAIGYIAPDKQACFNVAIRTLVLQNDLGELGIGGGIVYDSDAHAEYQEALLKAQFLKRLIY